MKGYAPGVYERWRAACAAADAEIEEPIKTFRCDPEKRKYAREYYHKTKAAKLCQA